MSTKSKKNEFSNEEMQILHVYMKRAWPVSYLTAIFISVYVYLMLNDKLDFSKLNKTSAKDLTDYSSRAKYVMLNLTPAITWIIIQCHLVVSKRMNTPAINPLLGFEKVVEVAKNNLTNTIEQFLMNAFTQFILVIHLEANTIVNVVPGLNLLFMIGRIAFWLGYPDYRTCGICTTMWPTMAIAAYNLYKFILIYVP